MGLLGPSLRLRFRDRRPVGFGGRQGQPGGHMNVTDKARSTRVHDTDLFAQKTPARVGRVPPGNVLFP